MSKSPVLCVKSVWRLTKGAYTGDKSVWRGGRRHLHMWLECLSGWQRAFTHVTGTFVGVTNFIYTCVKRVCHPTKMVYTRTGRVCPCGRRSGRCAEEVWPLTKAGDTLSGGSRHGAEGARWNGFAIFSWKIFCNANNGMYPCKGETHAGAYPPSSPLSEQENEKTGNTDHHTPFKRAREKLSSVVHIAWK